MQLPRFPALPAAFLLMLAAAGQALAADGEHRIRVTGEGSVSVAPDAAMISAGVVTQATTAKEALDQNSTATSAVIASLKAQSIDPKDIQTLALSVQPVYSNTSPNSGNAPPQVVAYSVTNTVLVRVRDLATLGAVIDKAVGAGANSIGNISFIVSKQSELLDGARHAAVLDAVRKATTYAEAAGAKVGPIISLAEGGAAPLPPMRMQMRTFSAAAVPVETGEQEIHVQVNAVFELDDH